MLTDKEVYDALDSLLLPRATTQAIQAGDSLVGAEGDDSALWLVESGALGIRLHSGEYLRLEAPTVVGEISLVGRRPPTGVVLAEEDVQAHVLHQKEIEAWGRECPSEALRVWQYLGQLAIRRLTGCYHRPYVVLVAHDGRKQALIDFVQAHRDLFSRHDLLATQTTASRLEQDLGLPVARRVSSGPKGGDQQIGGLVADRRVHSVFFLRDPLWAQPHRADIDALVRVCELSDVPMATNLTTAQALLPLLERDPPDGA